MFLRNTRAFTFSGLKNAFVAQTMYPVVLNTLSEATEVVWTQKYLAASLASLGK